MIKTYMTKKGWPILISSIEDIDFAKITSEFNLAKKTVRTEYTLPRIAFIGNFRTLSLTCQRHLAKNLGFEYIEEISFGTFSPDQMQLLCNKWPDITKDFTKLIVLGNPCIKSKGDGLIELDWEAEYHLFKTYKNNKKPVYLKYKIPIILESEIIKLHSEYPAIDNNTPWNNEPSLKYPKPNNEIRNTNINVNDNKNINDGINFGYNCKYLVPQHSKCEQYSQKRLSDKRFTKNEWLDLNKAILYSKIQNFDLIEKVKNGEIKVKYRNKKKNGSMLFLIKAAYEYDDCSLANDGGSCIYYEHHSGDRINCLMDNPTIKNHPNYSRYTVHKDERNKIIKRFNSSMMQDLLF